MSRKAKGFTLAEIIIAGFIIAMLCVGLRLILERAHSVSDKISARIEQYQKLRGCIDTLSRELPTAFLAESDPCLTFFGNPHAITFASTSNIPHKKGEYDIKEITYTFANGALRRHTSRMPGNPSSSASPMVLATGIAEVRFSYHDGRNWRTEWNSTSIQTVQSRLPCAVSVYLAVEADNEPTLTVSTVIAIPSG